jgi:hypothetical protein
MFWLRKANDPQFQVNTLEDDAEEKGMKLAEYAQIQIMSHDFGSVSQLWAEAAEWAVQEKDIWKSEHFRRWWRRAALARGHAEWLLQERSKRQDKGHMKAIESWRLRPPGSIGQYDNDCAIASILFVMRPKPLDDDVKFPFYGDDGYETHYNMMHTEMRDRDDEMFGCTKHSFLYGAPVSIQCFHGSISGANHRSRILYSNRLQRLACCPIS